MTQESEYKEAFTKYLQDDKEARTHNQQIVDAFVASIKPIQCRRIMLSTGVTLVTTAIDDHCYTVVEDGKLTRWYYDQAHIVGITEEHEVRPEDETEPFFEQYLPLGGYGITQTIWLLAGTDVKKMMEDFKKYMIRLPDEPFRPDGLGYNQADSIRNEVRIEFGYEDEAPF